MNTAMQSRQPGLKPAGRGRSLKDRFYNLLKGDRGKMKRSMLIRLFRMIAWTPEKMAEYAYRNTRFYRNLYGPVKKNAGRGGKVPFGKLPLVRKSDVHNVPPFDLLSAKLEHKVFRYGETTGSTGSPTPSFFTRKEFYGPVILSKITPYASILNKRFLKENRRAVCGFACGFTIAGSSFQQILDELGFLTVNVDTRTTIAPPVRVGRLLSRFLPSVVAASETDFLAWMRVLEEDYPSVYPEVKSRLCVLLSTAELCSASRSGRIAQYFDIVHIDNYACVEGYFSIPCPCGEKHILPIYKTEVLSPDLSLSSPYGTGRFAFTNLYRKSTPFVRYLLDDLVTIYQSRCPYGFTKSIIPHGRYEMTVTINGKLYGNGHFEELLFRHYLFGEYRVEVYDKYLKVTAEDYAQGNVPAPTIINDFTEAFGMEIVLEIVPYGALRDYRAIRTTKPLLRLVDKRSTSVQRVPEVL